MHNVLALHANTRARRILSIAATSFMFAIIMYVLTSASDTVCFDMCCSVSCGSADCCELFYAGAVLRVLLRVSAKQLPRR